MKLIIDLILAKHNMSKDLYQSKKIVADLGMNYKKIDVCEKNCMLFWKEQKDEDGVSVTTKVAVKQLCYMPITPRLKRLYLSEETVK
jgi:hypothetical protein